mgnify:CR=1 FL=1
MPNPTTAAEWAEKCNVDYLASMRVEGKSNGHVRHGLCTYCADAYARQQVEAALESLVEKQSFNDGLDDSIIHRLRRQVETLHGLVEEAVNGWKGALPHGEPVSMLVKQDRLTCNDLIQKADALFMSGGGKARDGVGV